MRPRRAIDRSPIMHEHLFRQLAEKVLFSGVGPRPEVAYRTTVESSPDDPRVGGEAGGKVKLPGDVL